MGFFFTLYGTKSVVSCLFFKSITCYAFFSPHSSSFWSSPHSCQKCNHAQSFAKGKRRGRVGGASVVVRMARQFDMNVGIKKKKAFVCVPNYHSSQPEVTFEGNLRTHTRNSYLLPTSLCVCTVTMVMRETQQYHGQGLFFCAPLCIG